MQRILEPELMEDPAQALAYHRADFSASHGRRVEIFRRVFPALELTGAVLDLGCGSGDVLLRFARAFPRARFVGIDGSTPMLELAQRELGRDRDLAGRVQLHRGVLPDAALPQGPWQLVMSHSLLHHLHRPQVLWEAIRRCAGPGTAVFVADLERPADAQAVQRLVGELSADEPPILQRDFRNSLGAAFELGELRSQLQQAGLAGLSVRREPPCHLIVHGSQPPVG